MVEKRYLDSSLDQSDLLENRSTIEFVGLETIKPDLGERQFPGQGGFRLADTPQAWIFVQKKEWLDDTWTYVVDTTEVKVGGKAVDIDKLTDQVESKKAELKRARERASQISPAEAEAEIKELQNDLKELEETRDQARAELTKNGNQSQTTGKLTQINIRSALGNIITRKLDWMNDHEKFVKKSPITQTQFEQIQIDKERKRLPSSLVRINEEQVRVTESIATLAAQNVGLNNSIQTLAFQIQQGEEVLASNNLTDDERAELISALSVLEQNLTVARNRIATNTRRTGQLRARESEIADLVRTPAGEADPIQDQETSLIYAPVTLSGNAFTRYYKSPVFRNADRAEVEQIRDELEDKLDQLESEAQALVNQTRTAGQSQELIQKQREYVETKRDYDSLRTRLELKQADAPIKLETGDSVFNGVIELGNVPNVTTNVTLEGEGSASFTIENPQNIFFISRDDIDLALTEDPFLDSTRAGVDGLVYYRGRFYPEHIVRMLQSRKGSGINVGNLTAVAEARIDILRDLIPSLDDLIRDKENQLFQLSLGGDIENGKILAQEIAGLKADQQTLIQELRGLEAHSLQQAIEDQVASDQESSTEETQEKEREMKAIRQTLLKYYAGKTVFQVLDRVYIWTTSPTRTLFRLNRTGDDRYAIEDPSVIALNQQLTVAIAAVENINTEIERARAAIRQALPTVPFGEAASEEDQVLPFNVNLTFDVGSGFSAIAEGSTLLFGQSIVTYLNNLLTEQSKRVGMRDFLQKQSRSTDSVTAANTFNKIPTTPGNGILTAEQRKDRGDYESRFLGLEEDRLQVFQGVISTVKQTYSNGSYQIQVSCKDNMIFLNMSRIMVKPALRNSGQSPAGILQDPIWRNNELAGNWKNGILVLDFAFVNDEVGANLNKKINLDADEQLNFADKKRVSENEDRRVSPFVTSLPFARIDAANLVSFIITGVPYNFEQFVKNASFGGRLSLDRKSGVTDQRSEDPSFFAFLKRQIGEVNDRLGDFEPFIDLTTVLKNMEGLKQRQTDLEKTVDEALDSLKAQYETYLLNRVERYLGRLKTPAANSILNTAKLNTVEKSLSLKGFQEEASLFRAQIEAASKRIRSENTKSVVELFSAAIQEAALANSIKNEAAERAATTGQVVGTETTVKSIVEKLAAGASGELGPFQIIAELLIKVATKTADTTTGKKQGPDTGLQTAKDPTSKAVDNALTGFVKELLTIQTDFAQEYLAASIASTNLRSFNAIRPQMEKLLADINMDAKAVARDFEEGPQATLEKIIRSEKKNFLIISDQYTLDDSIQAYHTEIAGGNFALFQSEFETAISVCRRAADQVDFEFFADENGNLQFKPPSYNRILREHFDLISETDSAVRDSVLIRYGGTDGAVFRAVLKGIALLNEIKNEFSTKRLLATKDFDKSCAEVKKAGIATEQQSIGQSTTNALQKVVDLGGSLDRDVKQELGGDSVEIVQREQAFTFLQGGSNNDLGKIGSIGVNIKAEEQAREALGILRTQEDKFLLQILLDEKLRLRTLDPLEEQLAFLKAKLKEEQALEDEGSPVIRARQREIAAAQSLFNKKKAEIRKKTNENKKNLYTQLLGRIEALLVEANNAREKARDKTKNFVNALPTFTDEHRIHRVADHDLISYDLTEAPPRFTHLEIQGSPELVKITPAEYYWAGGVDYDNWRQYGFMSESMQKAYFHSGDTARTYLRAMLGRERGRVLSASAQVRGDAKYRVGDCVFVECLGMYFYITSTSHSLSYGQSYNTNLTLAYGRRIGELIPHPFDALGKIMIETYQDGLEVLLARESFLDLKKQQDLRK